MVSLVRGTRTSQGAEVILVYDFMIVVYDKSSAEARQMWRALRARTRAAAACHAAAVAAIALF
jgi:hypothetical protein